MSRANTGKPLPDRIALSLRRCILAGLCLVSCRVVGRRKICMSSGTVTPGIERPAGSSSQARSTLLGKSLSLLSLHFVVFPLLPTTRLQRRQDSLQLSLFALARFRSFQRYRLRCQPVLDTKDQNSFCASPIKQSPELSFHRRMRN